MRRLILRLITAIQLTRLTIAFGAVSDIWFIILLTRAQSEYTFIPVHNMPVAGALAAGAIVAIGLFAYGASLNDILDVRHDSTFSPERPIPAGRIRLGQAVVVAVGSLMVAVLAASMLGEWSPRITMLTAAGILFYNATGKHIPAVGVLTMGLVHAAHMFIPNHQLTFTLPVWLIFTHAIVIAALVHVYEDKRPRFTFRSIAAVVTGWLLWSIVIIGAGFWRSDQLWPTELWLLGWSAPVITIIGFILVARWKSVNAPGHIAAEKLKRYGAMWQSLYGASWLLALNLPAEAAAIGLFAIAGFISMTLIKEIAGYSQRPVAYRA